VIFIFETFYMFFKKCHEVDSRIYVFGNYIVTSVFSITPRGLMVRMNVILASLEWAFILGKKLTLDSIRLLNKLLVA
jgi:hypothetical protein